MVKILSEIYVDKVIYTIAYIFNTKLMYVFDIEVL